MCLVIIHINMGCVDVDGRRYVLMWMVAPFLFCFVCCVWERCLARFLAEEIDGPNEQ